MKRFTVQEAVQALDGVYTGAEAGLLRMVTNVTTDSRTVCEGSIFIALRGARSDGHDFIAKALDAGAVLCVGERAPKDAGETPYVQVDSSLAAVGRLAAWYRGLFDIPVIGVTGSVGKTTTKEMIWSVLSQVYRTHKTQKNFNNELGVPQTLLAMAQDAQAAVVEMGISDFGEMTRLTHMVRPTIAVMSIIGYSHLEALSDRAGVLRAKSEIFAGMDAGAVAVVNGDDDLLRAMQPPVRKVTYGLDAANDYVARAVKNLGQDGTSCTICFPGGAWIDVTIPAYGVHMVYAALAAAAVGDLLGIVPEDIASGIASYETVGRRAHVVQTDTLTIIDDCYNANPSSVRAALQSLSQTPGRRVCILGDMLELGDETETLHADMGRAAAENDVNVLIACGNLSHHTFAAAAANGVQAHWFTDQDALCTALPQLLKKGDTVLVKASHSCGFDRITDFLTQLHL